MVAGVRGLVLALASTKSAPHRSGDPARLRRHEGLGVASTKSAPHRSGDPAVASSTSVRSAAPQRSPLPTGAETPVHGWARRSRLAGLNEVRSPQERRPARTRRACPMTGCSLNEVRSPQERRLPGREEGGHGADAASMKSAPHRSGDGLDQARPGLPDASTKSAPHRSGDSTSDYSPLTWADATVGEPWAQEASVERHAYRPRPMNRGLTSPFLMRRLAGFRTSTEPSRRSLARFR